MSILHSLRSPIAAISKGLALAGMAIFLPGCSPAFNVRAAKTVTRDRLLQLADAHPGSPLRYVGSDRAYHYIQQERGAEIAPYKVQADQLNLQDTFPVGEDSYVLSPW